MLANEDSAQQAWGNSFKDLNAGSRSIFLGSRLSPLDRIFIPIGQTEFSASTLQVEGPFGETAQEVGDWNRDHRRLRSDRLLIWIDVQTTGD
jgi:hypothetical protein